MAADPKVAVSPSESVTSGKAVGGAGALASTAGGQMHKFWDTQPMRKLGRRTLTMRNHCTYSSDLPYGIELLIVPYMRLLRAGRATCPLYRLILPRSPVSNAWLHQ